MPPPAGRRHLNSWLIFNLMTFVDLLASAVSGRSRSAQEARRDIPLAAVVR